MLADCRLQPTWRLGRFDHASRGKAHDMAITARSVCDALRQTLPAKGPKGRDQIDQEKKDSKIISGTIKERHQRDNYISIDETESRDQAQHG
jgi:hypothetical protein